MTGSPCDQIRVRVGFNDQGKKVEYLRCAGCGLDTELPNDDRPLAVKVNNTDPVYFLVPGLGWVCGPCFSQTAAPSDDYG